MKGDVVVVPFPFSDLSQVKRRPALIIATLQGQDLILCQITSRTIRDSYAVPLELSDFVQGALQVISNIRPNKLFTADRTLILYRIGSLKQEKIEEVTKAIMQILQ
ncbi:MAG TPA: type II toxin-antitoxin system PemK/MazF family toxin [Chloroflexia bacterium]|jgi:mRNA interferase MazF